MSGSDAVSMQAELHETRYIIKGNPLASGLVAQWIRHRPTEPGIAGSSPAGVIALAAPLSCHASHAWQRVTPTPRNIAGWFKN